MPKLETVAGGEGCEEVIQVGDDWDLENRERKKNIQKDSDEAKIPSSEANGWPPKLRMNETTYLPI